MKEIVVISGKGGTGKTVITAALAALAQNKIMADCDVDAADLHLILAPKIIKKSIFKSGKKAVIDNSRCTNCQRCIAVCRFDAISGKDSAIIIDPVSCEGCAVCSFICPAQAIFMKENISGEWFISDTRYGTMVHAKLNIAEENSGKLVSQVKQQAKAQAEREQSDYIIIDGAPGIGCPVIASIAGASLALVVTEPTLSGLHDADRVIKVARHFSIPVKLVINKYDLNNRMSVQIEEYCAKEKIEISGKIAFDKAIVEAVSAGKTIMESESDNAKKAVNSIWDNIK